LSVIVCIFPYSCNYQILNIYLMSVLLYGLELLTPTGNNLEIMDIFHKKCLKQLLSLPKNVATPDCRILTTQLLLSTVLTDDCLYTICLSKLSCDCLVILPKNISTFLSI
jgi:hypothetical protein